MPRTRKRKLRVIIEAQKGAQLDFLRCTEKYVAFFGGFGSGKTWVGASKAVWNSLIRFRGFNGMIIAPSYGDLQTYVVPELLERFSEVGIKAYYKASSPSFVWFWLNINGRMKQIKIHCRSGSHIESIVGFEVAWVWIDEACRIPEGKTPTKDVKIQSVARMRGKDLPGKQLFITSTHEGELTWPAQDWEEKPKKGHMFFRGSTFDNRYMKEFAEGLIEQYDPRLVEQYVKGFAVTISGVLVYYMFERDVWPKGNIDSSVKLDKNRPVCLSLDFNIAPGMHGTIGQYFQERDEFIFVDEIHALGMHVPHLVHEYHKRYGKIATITRIYGDSSGHARDEAIGETGYSWVERAMIEHKLAFNVLTPRSNPFVADRIISMNSAMGDGKGRHIRIHPRCKRLIRDFRNVQRDERGRIDKTQEGKGFVHMSDAASYWVHKVRPINRIRISDFSYQKG